MELSSLKPFRESPEARRFARGFAIVYFAEEMLYLLNLSITFLLKDTFGLSAVQTATFFTITVIPWLIKPVYGLISDSIPLFGQRRKSYFLLTSGLAATMGLTAPFQAVQWSSIYFAIVTGMTATLGYLGYLSEASAVVLSLAFGSVAMFMQLTFLDLAARVCPKQAEATFFALLMSVYNGAVQLSQIRGGWLYDQVGFTPLIVISAAFTALCWLLVPFLSWEELAPEDKPKGNP